MAKIYLMVTADFMPDGRIVPKLIRWEDGKLYEVQRVYEAARAASLTAGGTGIRYRCLIEGKQRFLFLEDCETAGSALGARFFVESK